MGFHKTSATRNMRQTHAHLDRKENGDVYAIFKLGFTKDSSRFEYCFIGSRFNILTYHNSKGRVALIGKHPKFKGVDTFESWCSKYCAEHDLDNI